MKKRFLKFGIIIALGLAVFAVADLSLAQELGLEYAENLNLSDGGGTDVRTLIVNIIRYALTFLGLIAVAMVMYGGFVWMTSNGSPERVSKAKRILIGAIIGLIIVLSAFAIVTMIVNFTTDSLEGGCTAGETKACGCNNIGTKICGEDNKWGACSGDCASGERCCSWGCDISCLTPPEFIIKNTIPQNGASDAIRNLKITYSFNRNILASSFEDAKFTVIDVNSGLAIAGSRTVSGNRIIFAPNADCGENPCGATNCFAAGQKVRVAAAGGFGGILSMGDIALSCPGTGLDCEIEFTVGDTIDCEDPKVSLDFNQICAVENNELYANATDDNGISQLEFFINDVSILDASNPADASGLSPYSSRSDNNPVYWDASALLPNTLVAIKVTASDIDSHSASDSKTYKLRPAHCCNGTLDEELGEEGIDCGGECAGCQGAACGISLFAQCASNDSTNCDNTLCAGGLCACTNTTEAECTAAGYAAGISDCCLCQDAPIIDYITPIGGFCTANPDTYCGNDDALCPEGDTCDIETANASAGSLVTISGRYFGGYDPNMSKVEFNTTPANLAQEANPACINSWQNNQIIVVLPNGLSGNPTVKVTAASGYYDTNNDMRGNTVEFLVNSISRPGLCLLDPDSGAMNAEITFQGIRLSNSQAYFGSYAHNVLALNSVFTQNTAGTAQVPNMNTGKVSAFVKSNNVNSNYLQFTKTAEAASGPYITSFSPSEGPAGQYITIMGGGFGRTQGQSKIYFDADLSDNANGNPADYGTEASYDFPIECQANLWSDNQVIIKVPALPANGGYYLVMVLADYGEPIDTADTFQTGSLSDPTFYYDSTLPLAPSLCRVDPVRGSVNSEVSLWGEYFGVQDTNSKVRFYNQQDGSILSWDAASKTNKIEAIVPAQAITGPVKVVKNSGLAGNGLNFFVGECKTNTDCDNGATAGICCPFDSVEAGRCAIDKNANNDIDIADCYGTFAASVYEWEFTTTNGLGVGDPCYDGAVPETCDISQSQCPDPLICEESTCKCEYESDPSDSCLERSQRENTCNPELCPNSPGQCSPYAGGNTLNSNIACTNDVCTMAGCTALTCSYSSLANKCVQNGSFCSKSTLDVFNNKTTAYCAFYEGANYWHINTSASCPVGWTSIGNGKCIENGTTCTPCPLGLSCKVINGNENGECVSSKEICPQGYNCDTGFCVKTDNAVCECCCRIGHASEDCCAPLNCESECGSDRINDTDQYGYCTGCRVENNGAVDTAASDAACNCFGSAGKFCDTEYAVNGVPVGACKDCAQLANNTSDCSDHGTVCCVDNKKSDYCRGIGLGEVISGKINYCAYYDCTLQNDACDLQNPKPDGAYKSTTTCASACKPNPANGLGLSCAHDFATITGCDTGLCAQPFHCINENAIVAPTAVNDCGTCCCDPSATSDECEAAGLDLNCVADRAPCDCPDEDYKDIRGLCCGCEQDTDCVAEGNEPTGVGCGMDACCRARPKVLSSEPADNSDKICRNAEINVIFDQQMDARSFTGNVIVAGDYGYKLCPAGTEYLALDGRLPTQKNFIARAYLKTLAFIKNFINPFSSQDQAIAYTEIDGGHNFCAVKGQASGYNNALGQGVLRFSPSQLLDNDRLYYVIIKGDSNLLDERSEGVKSIWGIGMNGGFTEILNGITYANSYIFSFTTLPEQAKNNGVCLVDSLKIEPDSYLFQTNINNLNDDDIASANFDTIKDSDKVFAASARGNGQILARIPDVYDWTLSWGSLNSDIADFAENYYTNDDTLKFVRAGTTKTEGYTLLTANMAYVANTISAPEPAPSGSADVYLFVCDNPWPPINSDGTWAPWQDSSINCLNGSGDCNNFNYKLYYCRDAGKTGTNDDLPAIKGGEENIIRGQTVFLSCSTTGEPCTVFNAACGPANNIGVCQSNFLKEMYLFREEVPSEITEITVINNADGQTATVEWADVAGDGYKLYWGKSSLAYDDYSEIYNDGTADKDNIACTQGTTFACEVSGLDNNTKYYFNVSSFFNTGTESKYFGEKYVIITDTKAPDAPSGLNAIPMDKQVKLSWDASEGAKGYKIYYGIASLNYGGSQDVGPDLEIIVSGLVNGNTYYFAVTAYDEDNNESAYSLEKSAVPAAMP